MKRTTILALMIAALVVVAAGACAPEAPEAEEPAEPEDPEEEEMDAVMFAEDDVIHVEEDEWTISEVTLEFEEEFIELEGEDDPVDGYLMQVTVFNESGGDADILVNAEGLDNGALSSAGTDEPLADGESITLQLQFVAEEGELPPEEGLGITVHLLER